MIPDKETQFLEYWKANREELAKPISKILRGLPVALLFVMPIILLVILVYIFSPDWYAKVAPSDSGTFYAIFLALFLTAVFIAYFRMQFKWESNEEYYKKILHRMKKVTSAP